MNINRSKIEPCNYEIKIQLIIFSSYGHIDHVPYIHSISPLPNRVAYKRHEIQTKISGNGLKKADASSTRSRPWFTNSMQITVGLQLVSFFLSFLSSFLFAWISLRICLSFLSTCVWLYLYFGSIHVDILFIVIYFLYFTRSYKQFTRRYKHGILVVRLLFWQQRRRNFYTYLCLLLGVKPKKKIFSWGGGQCRGSFLTWIILCTFLLYWITHYCRRCREHKHEWWRARYRRP